MDIRILRFDSLSSTNTEAAYQARQGAAEGLCVVADEQTGGRGRQGRIWTSEKGAGLYMSVVLRPRIDSRHLPLITLAAAVAVRDVFVEGLRIDADIKWPNDILARGRKICGILAETFDSNDGVAVVLGIGINVTSAPDENATYILKESPFKTSRDDLLDAVIKELSKVYYVIKDDPQEVVRMWSERSSYAFGLPVEIVVSLNETFTALTDGLEDNGALRVKLPDGSLRVIQAGDVQRLRTS